MGVKLLLIPPLLKKTQSDSVFASEQIKGSESSPFPLAVFFSNFCHVPGGVKDSSYFSLRPSLCYNCEDLDFFTSQGSAGKLVFEFLNDLLIVFNLWSFILKRLYCQTVMFSYTYIWIDFYLNFCSFSSQAFLKYSLNFGYLPASISWGYLTGSFQRRFTNSF